MPVVPSVKSGFLILALIFLGCKNRETSDAKGIFDVEPGESAKLAPASNFVLKEGLKRLIHSLPVVKQSKIQNGAFISSVIKVNVGNFETYAKGIAVSMLLDVSVKGRSSQYIALGASAGGTITYSGQAAALLYLDYDDGELALRYGGLTWPKPLSYYVSVWTNARVFRRKILSEARQQAYGKVAQGKLDIKRELDTELRTQIAKEVPNLQTYFKSIAAALEDVPQATPRLYSSRGKAVFQHLLPAALTAKVPPPPALMAGVDTGFSFHSDFFSYLLNRQLKGKNVPLDELQVEVCKSFTKAMYKFCSQEELDETFDAEIAFSEREPFEFVFENNQIRLILKDARVRIPDVKAILKPNKQEQADENLLSQLLKMEHVTPKVNIEITYRYDRRQFLRQSPKISLPKVEDTEGPIRQAGLYRAGLRLLFISQLEKVFPRKVIAPSVPAYIASDPRIHSVGGSFVIKDPAHLYAQNGWLAANFTYCSKRDTQIALGISIRETKDENGDIGMKVVDVYAESPASRATPTKAVTGYESANMEKPVAEYLPSVGLKADDVIYAVNGETTSLVNTTVFSDYLASLSLIPNGREVTLKVRRKQHVPDPESENQMMDIWFESDFKAELRRVCRSAKP